jgi:predicted permease
MAAALLFVTACLNAAGLIIARTLGWMHELAVRHALGAGRGRLLRQTLIDGGLLAVLAGIVAAGVSAALVRTLVALAPPELPRLEQIGLSARPFGEVAGLTAATMLLVGVLPALWTSSAFEGSLRAGDRSATQTRGRQRAQRALVVLQVALAIVVLTAAGLLARTLRALEQADPGFDAGRVAIVELAWPVDSYRGAARVSSLYGRLTSRLEALPDVAAAAPVNVVPFTGATGGWDGPLTIEGRRTGPPAVVNLAVVGPHYFRALRIGATRGRVFSDADRDGRQRVVVISARVADRLWHGTNAVGRRIAIGRPHTSADWWTVVGVVPETRYRAVRTAVPTVYFPVDQFGGPIDMIRTMVVRTVGEPAMVARSIRDAVRQEDPRVVIVSADPMELLLANQRARPRLDAVLLAVFAAGALLLAAVGLYAVLAYTVRQRTRELAIRHALGATPSGLALLVVRQALVTTGLGLALGIGAALSCAGLLRSLLFGVSPADPLTLASVAAILLATGAAASYLPARRAAAADPATALRVE